MRRSQTHRCRTAVRLGMIFGCLSLALVVTGCAVTEAQTQAKAAVAESIASLPYEKRICRLYFTPQRVDGRKRVLSLYGRSPEEFADVLADMGTEIWDTSATNPFEGKGAWFESEMVGRDPNVPPEHLKRLVKRAHERGMLVFACQQLSDVQEVDLKGEMDKWKVYCIDDGRPPCPVTIGAQSYASRGFADWMGRHMAEHIRVVGFDGFWFDGSPFGSRANGSPYPAGGVGPEARQRYKQDTGNDLPEKVDWNDPNFKQWVKWRYDVTVDFLDTITAIAARENPDVVPILNYYTRWPGEKLFWNVGHPMRKIHDSQWVAGIEMEESVLDKVGRALSPRTEMWFWAHESYVEEVVGGYLPYFDPDQQIAKGLRALAHGLAPCYGGFSADPELWKDSVKAVFDQLKARRDYITGPTVKYAAMVMSQQTRDFRQEYETMWQAARGVTEMHNATHLLLDVIFDDSLNVQDLSQYPVVIFDNVACLSDAQCDAIRQYVRNGGTIIAMMETSLYDEWGNRRDNFELADLFGVNYQSTEGEVTQIIVPQTEDLKEQFGRFINFVGRGARVRLAEGQDVEVLFTRSPLSGVDVSENIRNLKVKSDPYDSDEPAVVRRRVGRGAVIYFAADLGGRYESYARKFKRVADLLGALQRGAAEPLIEFDAPPRSVETTALWKDPDTIVAHIVNVTALSTAGYMAPVADIGITVNGRDLKRASSPITGRRFKVADNSINVPSVGYGEVIVLEIE